MTTNLSANPGRSVLPRAVAFSVIVLVVIAGLEIGFADHEPSLEHVLSLAMATLGPTLPIIIWKELRENPFHLLSYYYFKMGIAISLGAFVFHFDLIPHDRPDSIFAETCLVTGVSFLLVFVGYAIPVGRWFADRIPLLLFRNRAESEPDLGWGPYLTGLFLLYAGGWVGRIIRGLVGVFHLGGESGGGLVRFNFLWTLLPNLSKFSFIVIIGLWLSRKLPTRFPNFVPVALIFLEVFAGLYLGSRSRMVQPIIVALVAFHYVRSTVSWRTLIIGAVSLIFFVLPLTTLFRNHYFSQMRQGTEGGVETVVQSAGETYRRSDDEFDRAFTPTLARLTVLFDSLSRVLNRVPEWYEFQNGETYLEGMIMGVVPRVIYPEKGQYNPGPMFAHLFHDHPEDTDTNTGITTPGELYFNHGYAGLLGMIILGVLFRFLWERFRYQAQSEFFPLYRIHYLLFMVQTVSALAFYLPGLIRIAMMYYAGLVFLHRRLPRVVMPRDV